MRTITPKLDDYSLETFNFNLQVLATQYKVEEAQKVFDQMKIVGVTPDATSYTQLITAYAKRRDIDVIEILIEQGELFCNSILSNFKIINTTYS